MVGEVSSYVLMGDGTVRGWGYNGNYNLGDGTTTRRDAPISVFPSTFTAGTVVQLAGSFQHECALLANGRVQCWGYNGFGQLGDGTLTSRSTPARIPGLVIQLR